VALAFAKVTSLFRRNILSLSPFLLYTPKNIYDIETYYPLRNFLYLITSLWLLSYL